MPQISKKEFERLPLRAHQFLAGVPTVRRVDRRPAKPACRDDARRVFTRRERATLHAHAGRARAAGPTTSYRTPLRVGPPATVDPGQADVCRPAHRCPSGAIARASGPSRGAKWAVSRRLSVRETKNSSN